MRYNVLILLMLLAGCGEDEAPKQSAAQPPAAPAPAPEEPEVMTLALERADQLPACNARNERQLVYIIADQLFLVCDEGKWEPVDVKGRDGVDGEAGPQGDPGKDGRDGEAGRDGLDGADGRDGVDGLTPAVTGAASMWADPVTGRRWKLLGWQTRSEAVTSDTCIDGTFVLPTEAQMREAITNGISEAGGGTVAWLQNAPIRNWIDFTDEDDIITGTELTNEVFYVYCREVAP